MVMLLTFFISGSVVSKYKLSRKEEVQRDFEKGSERDIGQVLANAGLPTMAIFLDNFVLPNPIWFIIAMVNYAAKTGDTWATEIGTLSESDPYSITSFKQVPRGTAGAISGLGTFASVLGAFVLSFSVFFVRMIALVGMGRDIFTSMTGVAWILVIGTTSGVVGSVIDSFFATTIQRMHWCPVCKKETEKKIHSCGCATEYLRGWKFLTNDAVNFLSLVAAACFAILLKSILGFML